MTLELFRWGHEDLDGVQERFNFVLEALTEREGLDPTVPSVCLGLGSIHLEGKFVRAVELEDLEMLDLCIGEQDRVSADGLFWIRRGDQNIESGLVNLLILKGDLFEAFALEGRFWRRWTDLSGKDRYDHTRLVGLLLGAVLTFSDGHGCIAADEIDMTLGCISEPSLLLGKVLLEGQ